MQYKFNLVNAALATVFGVAATMSMSASAVVLPDGPYELVIVPTPVKPDTGSGTSYRIGTNGSWNSTFTFGGKPSSQSQGMTDNGTLVQGKGSSIASDGYAGKIGLVVSGSSITVTSFAVDTIFNTAGGSFAQSPPASLASMTGTIDQTTGVMTLTLTGRLGTIDSPVMTDRRWNVNDCGSTPACTDPAANPGFTSFSSVSAVSSAGTINGASVAAAGDFDSNGLNDYTAILVSGGQVGSDWQSFKGAVYYETWNVQLLRLVADTLPNAFSFATILDTATSSTITSAAITVSGINMPAAISVSAGGEYSIGGGAYTSAVGTVSNGQTVRVHHTSDVANSTNTVTTLTIGGVSSTFTSTTIAAGAVADTTPDAFIFADKTDQPKSTLVESASITVSGINQAAPISIVGGEYSIDGGAYTNVAGTVTNGQTVTVRLTTSGSFSTASDATLTIGGVSDTFTATTTATPVVTAFPAGGAAGGGCALAPSGKFDPVLPGVILAGLGYLGLRRRR